MRIRPIIARGLYPDGQGAVGCIPAPDRLALKSVVLADEQVVFHHDPPALPCPELRTSDPTEEDGQPPHLLVVPTRWTRESQDLLGSDLPCSVFCFCLSACDGYTLLLREKKKGLS